MAFQEITAGKIEKTRPISLLPPTVLRSNTITVKGPSNIVDSTSLVPLSVISGVETLIHQQITIDHVKRMIELIKASNDDLSVDAIRLLLIDAIGPEFVERHSGTHAALDMLLRKIDINGSKSIACDELCLYLLQDLQNADNVLSHSIAPLRVCPYNIKSEHRNQVVRLMLIQSPARFLTIGEDGIVCFWNLSMVCTRKIALQTSKQHKMNVTDVAFMHNASRIVVATVRHELCFFDSTTTELSNRVVDVPDIIVCLTYYVDPSSMERSWLIGGDSGGCVSVFLFISASSQLFNKPFGPLASPFEIAITKITRVDPLSSMPSVVSYNRFRMHSNVEEDGMHLNKSVSMVKVLPSHNSIVSCTGGDASPSLVFRNINNDGSAAVNFHVPKGVSVFDYSVALRLLVTAGLDCLVRLWNPYVPSQPLAVLRGHANPVMMVSFVPDSGNVISVTTNEIIKLWDIQKQICTTTLVAVIPHMSSTHTPGALCMLWHDSSQSLVCASRGEFGVIQMVRDEVNTTYSHSEPIVSLVLFDSIKLVVSGDVFGEVTAWDLVSGQQASQIRQTHPNSFLTAMCAGADTVNNKRLMTGASDGSIRVWDIMGGLLLQQLTKEIAKEVTGLISVKGFMFSVGWDRIVTCFLDEPIESIIQCPVSVPWDENYRHLIESMGPVNHDDDIVSMACCQETLLATGSFDGVVIVRHLKSGKLISKLITPPTVKITNSVAELKSPSIESLVWLASRSHGKVASLISSADGSLYFWNVFTSELVGVFKPLHMEEKGPFDDRISLGCLATDVTNSVVVVGDTIGYIRIFSIMDKCMAVSAGESFDPSRKKAFNLCTLIQLKAWKAHSLSISSMLFIDETCQIVTGSADKLVKVWTCTGQLINIFNSNNAGCTLVGPFPTVKSLFSLSEELSSLGDDSKEVVAVKQVTTAPTNLVVAAPVISAGIMSPGDKARTLLGLPRLSDKVNRVVADAAAAKMEWRKTFHLVDLGGNTQVRTAKEAQSAPYHMLPLKESVDLPLIDEPSSIVAERNYQWQLMRSFRHGNPASSFHGSIGSTSFRGGSNSFRGERSKSARERPTSARREAAPVLSSRPNSGRELSRAVSGREGQLVAASDGGLAPPTPGKFKLPPLKLDKIKREGNPNFGSQQFTMTSVTRKDFDAEPLHAATSTTLQKGGLLAAIHVK